MKAGFNFLTEVNVMSMLLSFNHDSLQYTTSILRIKIYDKSKQNHGASFFFFLLW
jgi:hypothetical protein